jgi:hypothetical protein
VEKGDEMLALILGTAASVKIYDQLRRTARDLRTQVAKCIEDKVGICEHLFLNVTYLSFCVKNSFKRFIKIRTKLTVI